MADEQAARADGGTPTPQAPVIVPTAGAKVEFTPEQQTKLTEIINRERKEWEKSHSEDFKKAKAHDELIGKQKQQEDAEKSELQKLKDELEALRTKASRVDALEEKFKAMLEAKLALIPEDKRTLVDALPEGTSAELIFEWIEKNSVHLYGTQSAAAAPGGGGKLPIAKPDPLREKALEILESQYPENDPIRKDAVKWEEKIQLSMKILKEKNYPAPQIK